jgi:hypothetical protein
VGQAYEAQVVQDRGLSGGGGRELRIRFVAGEVGRVGFGAEVCGVVDENPRGEEVCGTPVAGCAGVYTYRFGVTIRTEAAFLRVVIPRPADSKNQSQELFGTVQHELLVCEIARFASMF